MAKFVKQRGAAANPVTLHKTVDVPQANKLENVRQLAAAVRDGITHPAALRELLEVDSRHFLYYRQAALVLRVLTEASDGSLTLTDAGRELLGTAERSRSERDTFRSMILSAPSLKPFSSFFEGEGVSAEEIAHRLGVVAGLSHSTAVRRTQTLVQWRRYISDSSDKRAKEEPLPDTSAQVEGLVARHNALAKQRYIERLLKSDPKHFEELVGRLATAMGYQSVKVIGGSRDGGVDVRATKTDEWGHPVPAALQAKRYSKPVGRRVVDEMIGVLSRERCPHGILVTTSEFSTQALAGC